ncbi:sigma-B regulation protein RsbU (phosphoserine phosphatase) [Methanophagales archaeon]|nr:sigma-B regulation protein RsbU (phosphoserine phosphatase) [Methanophagales archaeon]
MSYPIIELLLTLVEKICVIVVIAYLITRTKYFMEILDKKFTLKNRVILILIFGAVSIFGTYSGIEIFGAFANVQDLGPMIAGLIGGPVIGVGAGLIGGVHRYFLGGFTCVPCSLATVLAGLFGGIVYLLRKGKFIGVPGAVLFAALMETFHMILVLIIARPYSEAVVIVEDFSIPMIFSNSLGMFFFAFIISNLIKERETAEERDKYFDELERKRYELKIAHDIQQSFLPDAIPVLKGFDLAALNLPAKEVGGDFYDFILVSEDKIGVTIADVSGNGVPAALFMALSRTIVRANATRSPGVADVIQDANRLITSDAKSGMFVTLFYAILDLREKTLTYVNAGHNPPVMFKGKTGELIMLKAKGIALGALEDIKLEERKIILNSGDVVVFYTDGVTEAVDDREEQFGEERLFKAIKENHNLSAKDIIEKINEETLSFCGKQPQFDDITLMALKAE